jgi:outer membrane murein-binding lipoprotein Lpp
MSARFPTFVRVLGGAAFVLAVFSSSGCDDPAKVKALEDKVTALEEKITELESKIPVQYVKPDKDDEYATAVAGAAVDSLLAGDVASLRGNLTAKLLKGIEAEMPVEFLSQQRGDGIPSWVGKWNPSKAYKSYTIEKVVVSPTKDEIIVTGMLIPKAESAEQKKGSFSLTMFKDKDKGKFMIDAGSAKP